MYKVVNLGTTVPDTGEIRVQLLGEAMVKTASSEIQTFWDTLAPNAEKAYLYVIAMSAWEYYGPNNNGDSFYEKDLRTDHPSFLKDGNIFLHHANKDPKKSAGKPIFSYYNEVMHRVELVLAVDKTSPNAAEVLRRLNSGEQIYVSMGVNVKNDVCSICSNKAKTRADYCVHLRYQMKQILDDGRQVHAFNPAPLKFFDISLVNKPADRTAWALAKIARDGAGQGADTAPVTSSAELGEQAEYYTQKLAAITKFSDLIKYIDGDVVDIKDTDTDGRAEMLRKLKQSPVALSGWPTVDSKTLMDPVLSPGDLLGAIVGSGGFPSMSESAHICGRHCMGSDFVPQKHIPQFFSMLPSALSMLQRTPTALEAIIGAILKSSTGAIGGQAQDLIQSSIAPAVQGRIIIIQQMAPGEALTKQAGALSGPKQLYPYGDVTLTPADYENMRGMTEHYMRRYFSPTAPGNMDEFTVIGADGLPYTTTRTSAEIARVGQDARIVSSKVLSAALGLAALGAASAEKNVGMRALIAPALAIAAYKMWTKKNKANNTVLTTSGHEVPATSLFETAARRITKTAAEACLAEMWPVSRYSAGLDYVVASKG